MLEIWLKKAADEVVKQTCDRINESNLPIFVTDGRKHYKQALLDRYSYFEDFPKTGKRVRPRKPKQKPLKKLKYAQIVKKQDGGKLSSITKRVVFGDFKDIDDSMISTSLIERENLNLRQEKQLLIPKKMIGFNTILLSKWPHIISHDHMTDSK